MANLTNSNKLIGKFAQIDSDISEIKESLPADGVGEGVITLGINDEGIGEFNVNQKNNESINFIINRNTVGLGNVNNTSDMDKPVSTAQQAALDLKADKVDTYTKDEVDDLLAGITGIEVVVVEQLPQTGENGKIYLVENSDNTYDEYIWVASENSFEKIGSTDIDLSNYYTKSEVDDLLDQKADASDIPTVNDAVLIIKKNGTTQGTFSANQGIDETINLTINKIDVGLSNVDNTSDLDKPISTATQAALDLKADKTELPTVNDARITVQKNSESVDSFTLNQNTDNTINITINKNDVGLGNVDNTSDADKPISDATQAALDLKADKTELPIVNDATVTVKQGTTTKGTFTLNQAGDVTIELDEGGDGDVKYADFEFSMIAQSPDGEAIIGQMLSGILNINKDLTLLPHDELKAGMQYLVRVNNTGSTDHDVTFDGVAYTVKAGETKNLVFLAVDGSTLELQECTGGSIPTPSGEGDMKYVDFNFEEKSGVSVELSLSSSITPEDDFTVVAPSEIQDGQVYVLRVTNEGTPVTMTLGTGFTNPFNIDLTLTEDGVDQFVFLATEGVLELQPQLLTKADVEQILRDHGLIP